MSLEIADRRPFTSRPWGTTAPVHSKRPNPLFTFFPPSAGALSNFKLVQDHHQCWRYRGQVRPYHRHIQSCCIHVFEIFVHLLEMCATCSTSKRADSSLIPNLQRRTAFDGRKSVLPLATGSQQRLNWLTSVDLQGPVLRISVSLRNVKGR